MEMGNLGRLDFEPQASNPYIGLDPYYRPIVLSRTSFPSPITILFSRKKLQPLPIATMATAFATPKGLFGAKGFPLTCQPQHQRSTCSTTFITHSNRGQERWLRLTAHYSPIGQPNPFIGSHKNRYQGTTPTHPISSINNTYTTLFPQESFSPAESANLTNRLSGDFPPKISTIAKPRSWEEHEIRLAPARLTDRSALDGSLISPITTRLTSQPKRLRLTDEWPPQRPSQIECRSSSNEQPLQREGHRTVPVPL